MPSHYLTQWWDIVDWTRRNKLQRIFNRNSNIFIQENALENIVCKMAAILYPLQCGSLWHNYITRAPSFSRNHKTYMISAVYFLIALITHVMIYSKSGQKGTWGKMEHRVIVKNHAWCGSIFTSSWLLSSACSASYIEVKLAVDPVLSISQNPNFIIVLNQSTRV